MSRIALISLALAGLLPLTAQALERQPSVDGAKVYFIGLDDGATVKSPVLLRFGLSGMGVAPAGINLPKTGHHHLLVDAALPEDLSQPLPATEHYRHFGGGQTEVLLELTPGVHTLQLMLGDYLHVAHEPALVSDVIRVTVE